MFDFGPLNSIKPHPRAVALVTVDGLSLAPILDARLIALTHTDNRGFEADTVEITLDDTDGVLNLPPRGAELTLAIGWEAGAVVPKGSYTVDEVTHTGAPDQMTIRAKSSDMATGLTTQRERSFHGTTVGAIVRTIADENGLLPAIHKSLDGLAIEHIDQTNESGANLLTRLAQMFDAIATVKDGRLLFIPSAGGVTASGNPIPTVHIVRKSGDRHQFTIADRGAYNAVRALYNDLNHGVKGEVTWGNAEDGAERHVPTAPVASAPVTGQYKALPSTFASRHKAQRAAAKAWKSMQTNKAQRAAYIGIKANYNDRNLGSSGDVTYGQSDVDKKRASAQRTAKRDADKLKSTTEPSSANAFTHTADNLKILRHVYANKTNATRAARAEWRRLQRGMANFSITLAEGLPELFPEVPATVEGFKPQIDSTDWIIIKISNSISGDGGYTQMLEFEIKATEIPD